MSYPRDYVACGGYRPETDSAAAAASAPAPAHPASITFTLSRTEAATVLECFQHISDTGVLSEEEEALMVKLDAYFS